MIEHFRKITGGEIHSSNKNGVFGVPVHQESKLQLYLLLAKSRTLEQKTIKHTHRLPEFIYIQQSNSLTSYVFSTSEFEQGGKLYTPGSNVIKEALESISHKIDDPRYTRGVCYTTEVSLTENDFVEKRDMYWLARKGTNFIIYLDMEVIFGEDYKINPEKYSESDLVLPLYQAAQKYEIAPNLKIAEELKKAYDLMGFSIMAAEVEKKSQRPKRYCVIV